VQASWTVDLWTWNDHLSEHFSEQLSSVGEKPFLSPHLLWSCRMKYRIPQDPYRHLHSLPTSRSTCQACMNGAYHKHDPRRMVHLWGFDKGSQELIGLYALEGLAIP
jgi:carbohydrate-selective porin OprB